MTYRIPFPSRPLEIDDIPAELKRFWHTFRWNANPCILDVRGNVLLTSTYTRIADCSLVDLQCERIGPSVFRFSKTSATASSKPPLCGKITQVGQLYPAFCARHPCWAGVYYERAAPPPEPAAI